VGLLHAGVWGEEKEEEELVGEMKTLDFREEAEEMVGDT
jgi:hypothetical protein